MSRQEHETALVRLGEEPGQIALLSPRVGLWRSRPPVGGLVRPGASIGAIEVLGRSVPVVAPVDAGGVVVSSIDDDRARVPVGYGDVLLTLNPSAGAVGPQTAAGLALGGDPAIHGLAFVAPMSGRFYAAPGPDKPPFVAPGQTVRTGDTVCLLEVMKTFNRVTYGGAALPTSATVKRVVPRDGDDLDGGDPILELELEGE